MRKRKFSPVAAHQVPLSLPATAEAEWRLSYRFVDSSAAMGLSLGAGIVALLVLVARVL